MRLKSIKCAMLLLGASGAAALAATEATAATQGSLGATSTGTMVLGASVPGLARITGLTDVTWANQDPSIAATNAQNLCVWSNTATKAYTVTATGSGASSVFSLTNGSTTVPYSVEWNSAINQASGTALATGVASASLVSSATNQTCASGPTASASLIVGITTADLGTMSPGPSYTGTLTIIITPQ
jgi:hypothetical protein